MAATQAGTATAPQQKLQGGEKDDQIILRTYTNSDLHYYRTYH